jgi:predicted DNA-binding protein (MmcQ/YjbR family)
MRPHWTISPERLERLRGLCLGLPDASEKVAWGDPTWRVRDRIFAMQKGNHEGGRPSLWLKGAPGAQDALVAARPSVFFVPPYVGQKGWVGIYLDGAAMPWGAIADLIVESWRLIAGPRLAAQLAEAPLAKRASGTRAAKKKTPARKAAPVRRAKKRAGAKR